MKYLLMIYGNQEKWESSPAEQWPQASAKPPGCGPAVAREVL